MMTRMLRSSLSRASCLVGFLLLAACRSAAPIAPSVPVAPLPGTSFSSSQASSVSPEAAALAYEGRSPLLPTKIGLRTQYGTLTPDTNIGPINGAAPTTKVEFRDAKKGLRVLLPYNPAWGNDRYRIRPFDVGKSVVVFGPVTTCSDGSLCREQSLTFEPAQTSEAVMAAVTKQRAAQQKKSGTPSLSEPRRKTVGEVTVVEYTDTSEACVRPTLVIVGKKFNYAFSMCGGRVAYFEEIVKTAQLIEK